MLVIILNWIYVIFTAFCVGYAFDRFAERVLHYSIKRADAILMSGLIIATVYAQVWSLFGGVSLAANVTLMVFCLAVILFFRKRIVDDVRKMLKGCSVARLTVIVLLFLTWAYFTSRGYLVYDSDLYHGQSIRWVEEYGAVKGLGNLHERFAYNSSIFSLAALYSMKFLLGQSLHTLSGFFALLLSITTLDVAHSFKRKKLLLSDYARIGAIYYLTTICDEVVSPSSDYAIMCVLFYIVIKWLDVLEDKERCNIIAPYALLCVAGVYALTLKLTAGLILLLLIKPAYMLIKEKRVKEIFLYLAMGLLVAVPWFTRTVFISGYLMYPFAALDLFSVDWKMNRQIVEIDSANIKTWARGLRQADLVNVPITQWFGNWFKSELSKMEKLLVLADIAGAAVTVIAAVRTFVQKKWENLDKLLVITTILCSYLFWQFSAPMARYGYAYLLLAAALPFGWLLMTLGKDRIFYWLILIYGVYKLCAVMGLAYNSRMADNYIWQQEYGTYELGTYEVDGITFYYGLHGDRTGYEAFPTSDVKKDGLKLRGEDLSDGFYK